MKLVIDANIVFSALVSPIGKTCDLLFSNAIELSAPEFLFEELEKYKQEILAKSGLAEVELDLALSLISSKINFISFSEFQQFIIKAKEICPDPNDTEYFALALKLNCPVWSNDKRLKGQNSIKVYSTSELLKQFG